MKIILILLLFTFILSLQLYRNVNLEKIQAEIESSREESIEIKENYISKYPNSTQSVLFLFQTNKPEKAKSLLNKLISKNVTEAIYANALLSMEGKYLPTSSETGIDTLKELCVSYIEPCIYLGRYYRKNKEYKSAIYYLEKVKKTNEIVIFSELRLIYANKKSSEYNPDKASYYASKMTCAIHNKTRTNYHLTKYN